jgi:lipopolysaccharide biosynthesis protein
LNKNNEKNIMKLIAFYLPQFHEIEENNLFWGKGFTEWDNVRSVKSIYPDHKQPRFPLNDLGYYDLNDNSVRHKQSELAKSYGIDGWCYYYYRFNGKKVLEMPLNKHCDDKGLNMPFCVCWANENWTRTWEGYSDDVLIEQKHSFEDDLDFIKDISTMFSDERYIKIDNKPIILIYRTELWSDIKKTVSIWREYVYNHYGLEIYLIRCNGFDRETNPLDIGFDASYQFPPFGFKKESFFDGEKFEYKDWLNFIIEKKDFKLFRGVLTSFDNTPRLQDRNKNKNDINWKPKQTIGFSCLPKYYGSWLSLAMLYTEKYFKKSEQLVFINAWNEWGEGAILEPCNIWGYDYLKSTLYARNILNEKIKKKRIK